MNELLGWLCAAEQQAFLVGSSQAAILHVGEDDLLLREHIEAKPTTLELVVAHTA